MSTPPESGTKRPRLVPDGIAANKRDLAQRGGLAAVGLAACTAIFGAVVLALTSSTFFGVLGFMCITIGVPLLPILGIPAKSGGVRWIIALAGSGAMWWWIGQLSAARVRTFVIAGWSEWGKEFGLYAGAVAIGVVGAIIIAARALGAL